MSDVDVLISRAEAVLRVCELDKDVQKDKKKKKIGVDEECATANINKDTGSD